jgi:hypothetical protein
MSDDGDKRLMCVEGRFGLVDCIKTDPLSILAAMTAWPPECFQLGRQGAQSEVCGELTIATMTNEWCTSEL